MSLRWNEDFTHSQAKKQVNVNPNGDFDRGKTMYVEDTWTLEEFLTAASQRLEFPTTAQRLFSADGVEIDDCMMLEDNDILFLSTGEEFIPPFQDDNDDIPEVSRTSGDVLPLTVGGYRVGSFLGKGGFGEVRIGEHQVTGDKVALKFIRKADIGTIGAAERTTTEIQCLTSLKHQNIIELQQYIEAPAHFVLVFELMEGGDLLNYLVNRGKETSSSNCILNEEEARDVFQQIISAVSYAHNKHICHRDLKLENILLKDKDLNQVKIADFGLSDFYRPGAVMKSNCGTLSFLAPEVFRGTSNAGPPLDVWSLGVILFAILCGRLPFNGSTGDMSSSMSNKVRPRETVIKAKIMKCQYKLDDSLGPEVKDLIRRMLKLDPTERATIPEIFSHVWLRSVPGAMMASPLGGASLSSRSRASSIAKSPNSSNANNANNSNNNSYFTESNNVKEDGINHLHHNDNSYHIKDIPSFDDASLTDELGATMVADSKSYDDDDSRNDFSTYNASSRSHNNNNNNNDNNNDNDDDAKSNIQHSIDNGSVNNDASAPAKELDYTDFSDTHKLMPLRRQPSKNDLRDRSPPPRSAAAAAAANDPEYIKDNSDNNSSSSSNSSSSGRRSSIMHPGSPSPPADGSPSITGKALSRRNTTTGTPTGGYDNYGRRRTTSNGGSSNSSNSSNNNNINNNSNGSPRATADSPSQTRTKLLHTRNTYK